MTPDNPSTASPTTGQVMSADLREQLLLEETWARLRHEFYRPVAESPPSKTKAAVYEILQAYTAQVRAETIEEAAKMFPDGALYLGVKIRSIIRRALAPLPQTTGG